MNRLLVLPVLLVTLAVLLFSTTGREAPDLQKRMDAAKRQNVTISLYGTALQGWKILAKDGDAEAQYNLGNLYRVGHGFTENDKTAVKWYTFAAKQGHSSAQYFLGWMYADGEGVIQDNVRAHMWLNIAASSGECGSATENRDRIAKGMTPADISTAQKRARQWISKNANGVA